MSRRAGAAAAVLALAALGLAIPGRAEAQVADLTGVGYTKGADDAPVVVVEYADFACSACAEFVRDSWPAIERTYIATGIVRWHLVPFELGFRNSEEGARAGECAGALGSFWAMHDLLFARRDDWEDERRPEGALVQIAADAGMAPDAFRRCYQEKDGHDGEDRTRAANRAARTDAVRATPTFFINGFRVQGALPFEAFSELIEAARTGPRAGH